MIKFQQNFQLEKGLRILLLYLQLQTIGMILFGFPINPLVHKCFLFLRNFVFVCVHHNLQFLHRTFEPYYERIELESFLHVRVQSFEKLYPSLTFHYETIPTHVYADSDALVRILDNLLSNACKYNHKKGHVTLHVSAMSLRIEDTGIGIEHPEKVFERYYKESSRGLGLGLHIVKTLCDAQGIQLALESQKGVGTRVSLMFTKEKA